MCPQQHLLIARVRLAPGEEWAIKANGWLFLQLQEGQAYWLWPPHTTALGSGELMLAAPAAQGCLRASQLGDVAFHHLDFCPELLNELLTFSDYLHIKNCAAQERLRVRTVPADHMVARQFAVLCAGTEGRCPLFARFQILNCVGEAFAHASEPLPTRPAGERAAGERLVQILSQLPSAEFIKRSADELAGMCGCSTRHLRRLFQQHNGVSLRDSQTELRLQKARRLLAETDNKILHVALECGYQHISLFNALFKRRFGMPPSQWRLRSRNNRAKNES